MIELVKIKESRVNRRTLNDSEVNKAKALIERGFKELKISDKPYCDNAYSSLSPIYTDNGDYVTLEWREERDKDKVQLAIDSLKESLVKSDYKHNVLREFEAVGKAYSYTLEDLYNEREPIREQIRELEKLL